MLKKIILFLVVLTLTQQSINAQFPSHLSYCHENPQQQECKDYEINNLKDEINHKKDLLTFNAIKEDNSLQQKLMLLELQEEVYRNSITLLNLICIKDNTNHDCHQNWRYYEYNSMLDDIIKNISELKIHIKEKEIEEENAKKALDYLHRWLENLNNTNTQTAISFFSSSCEYKKSYECLYYLGLMYDKKSEFYKQWTRDSYIYGKFSYYRDIAVNNLKESLEYTDDEKQILKTESLINEIKNYDFYTIDNVNTIKASTNDDEQNGNTNHKSNDWGEISQDWKNINKEAGIIIERLDNITKKMGERRVIALYVRLITALEKFNNRQKNEVIEEVIQILKNRKL